MRMKNYFFVAALLVLGAVFLISGCGKSEETGTLPEVKEAAPVDTAPAAEALKEADKAVTEAPKAAGAALAQTTCPVMGGKIDKKYFADHKGARVYFCCAACIDTFKKDPQKYITKLETQGVALDKVSEIEKTIKDAAGGLTDKLKIK